MRNSLPAADPRAPDLVTLESSLMTHDQQFFIACQVLNNELGYDINHPNLASSIKSKFEEYTAPNKAESMK
jgi:hypothetical protein